MPLTAFALVLASLAGSPAAAVDVPATLRVCDEIDEYPPFVYYRRENGRQTDTLVGYSVEYLTEILAGGGRSFTIKLLPWQRCVDSVRIGQEDLALDASEAADRDRDFVFSPPYSSLTPMIYFVRAKPAPRLDTVADLEALRICGQFGNIYTAGWGVPEALVDRGAKTLEEAANKLRAGRCDVVLADAEIVAGQSVTLGHPLFPDTEIASRASPGARAEPVFMMVGRTLPYRDALIALLSRGVADMQASGAAKRLSDRYLGTAAP
jgi:polar amino acid transport system substrate-binding protein